MLNSSDLSTLNESVKTLTIVLMAQSGCTNEQIRNAVKISNNQISAIAGPVRTNARKTVAKDTS